MMFPVQKKFLLMYLLQIYTIQNLAENGSNTSLKTLATNDRMFIAFPPSSQLAFVKQLCQISFTIPLIQLKIFSFSFNQ